MTKSLNKKKVDFLEELYEVIKKRDKSNLISLRGQQNLKSFLGFNFIIL